MKEEKGKEFWVVFIIFFTFLVYSNSIFNPFIGDDISLICENPFVKNLKLSLNSFSKDIYIGFSKFYRPLQIISYALIYRIFKLAPSGYHLLNIFLHSGCAILFYLLLKEIYDIKISFLVSLLWAIHPIHTEAITYISGTADPLFLLFGLLGIYLYNRNFKILSYISFFASLLSKETAVLILPFFFLYQYSTGKLKRYFWKDYIIIFLIFLIYFLFRFAILNMEKVTSDISFQYRFFTAFQTFFIYISLLIFPFVLTIERHIPYIKTWKNVDFIAGILYFLLFLYLLWIKRENKKILFPGLLFLGNWIFHSNIIIPLNGNLREHWMYMGSAGFFIYFVFFMDKIKKEKPKKILLIIIFFLYGIRTILRNYDWKYPEKFYLKSIEYSFYPTFLYGNLCYFYINNGEYEKSYQLSKKAISLGIKNETILYIYGVSLSNMKRYEEAENVFKEILKINPENCEVLTEMGELYFIKRDVEKAEQFLNESLKLNPDYPKTYYVLTEVYRVKGNIEKIWECIRKLKQYVPYDFYPYYLEGLLFKEKGDFENAYKNFQKAYSILKNKKDFHSLFNLGILTIEMGKIDESLNIFTTLLKIKPEDIEVMNEIGICYAIKGNREKAKEIWEKILLKNPEYYPARENLKRLGF